MSEIDKKRKYLLFSKDDGRPDHLKPCAFFLSDAGCKNGDRCKFSHGKNETVAAPKSNNERPVSKPVVENISAKPSKEVYKAPEVKSAEKKQKKEEYVEPKYVEKYVEPNYVEKYVEPKYTPTPTPTPAPVRVPVVALNDTKQDEISELKAMLLQQQQMFAEQMKQMAAAVQKPAVIEKPAAPKQSMKEKGKEIAAKRASASGTKVAPPAPKPVYVAPPVAVVAPVQKQPTQQHAESDDSSDDEETSDDGEFLFDAVNLALKDGRNSFSNQESISSQSRKALPPPLPTTAAPVNSLAATNGIPTAPVGSGASMFLTAESALKSLQTSGTKHATHGTTKKSVFANPKVATSSVAVTAAPAPKVLESVAVFDPTRVDFSALPWTNLVVASQSHMRYKKEYAYEVDSTWVRSRPVGDWSAGRKIPTIIAIDCEMCETADPVTGAKNNSLIRLSIVNGINPAEVIIDTLVVPADPITDMRSHIHGITEEHLNGQKFTLRQAQAFLFNLCSENTIIVGHSVHNDLKSLHFQHYNIIDTSYLYTLENEPNAAASVRDISEQVLGVKLADIHDSIQDARSALYVASVILISGPHKPLQRTSGNLSSSAKNAVTNSFPHLLVHRIPDYCTEEHIREMMIQHSQIHPVKVHPIVRNTSSNATSGDSAPSGKAMVQFTSQQHTDLAFDSISGPNRPDKQNRSQKRIYLKGGGYICVRK